MIAGLQGRLHRKAADHVIVDVGGVRYQCAVSLSTLAELGPEGGEVELFVHTHLREDALLLFGFAAEREKALFLALVGVSGIGPKLAMTILSGIPAAELARIIAGHDLARLTAVPGIGKKTAERIIVELADKLAKLAEVDDREPLHQTARLKREAELGSALSNLGYKPRQISSVLERLAEREPVDARLEDLIRAALRELQR